MPEAETKKAKSESSKPTQKRQKKFKALLPHGSHSEGPEKLCLHLRRYWGAVHKQCSLLDSICWVHLGI